MREAKLFVNGNSQAVRLPKAFRFPGKSVYVKRVGAGVLLLPKDADRLETMFASLEKFDPEFMRVRDQGGEQRRPGLESLSATSKKRK
jgi:antitoxin VapB